jgi:hypothetical protein
LVALTNTIRLLGGQRLVGNIQHYPDLSSPDPDAKLASVFSEDLSAYRFHTGDASVSAQSTAVRTLQKQNLIFILQQPVETNLKG